MENGSLFLRVLNITDSGDKPKPCFFAYVKRKKMKMTYHKLSRPWRLYVTSVTQGFRGEDDDALAMRSGEIALGNEDGPCIGSNSLPILDFVSKKQT